MHLTRQGSLTKFPIPRKGTKYVAIARNTKTNSVPVIVAVRDILGLAKTTREVRQMVNQKLLKINGRVVTDTREAIKLFNIFQADKTYKLIILPTNKFSFEETSDKDLRLCKVTGKTILPKSLVQLNLNEGSNVLTKEKISVDDSLYLDFSGKIKKHVALEKGKDAFIIAGKYIGQSGKIQAISGKLVKINLKEKEIEIPASEVIVQ